MCGSRMWLRDKRVYPRLYTIICHTHTHTHSHTHIQYKGRHPLDRGRKEKRGSAVGERDDSTSRLALFFLSVCLSHPSVFLDRGVAMA